EYTITSPSAIKSSPHHASDTSYSSIVRRSRASAPGPPVSVAVSARRLRMGCRRQGRRDEAREAIAALVVVAELVEARASWRKQNDVAFPGHRKGTLDRRLQRPDAFHACGGAGN